MTGTPRIFGLGDYAYQAALQLPDVPRHPLGHVFDHFRRQMGVFPLGLLSEDLHPGLEVRRSDGRDQDAVQPRLQFVGEFRNVFRIGVAGVKDSLPPVHQLIQRIDQFVLDLFLAAQKFHFFEQEHIAFGAKLCS